MGNIYTKEKTLKFSNPTHKQRTMEKSLLKCNHKEVYVTTSNRKKRCKVCGKLILTDPDPEAKPKEATFINLTGFEND